MTAQIPLTKGYVATVDESDYDRLVAMGRWCASVDGRTVYAGKAIPIDGRYKTVLMHRVITGWGYVDHANGDGLDNRRVNLRSATHAENHANRRKPITNTSGFKGVTWDPRWAMWVARIGVRGRRLHLGGYPTPEEAARAYDTAALEHFGEFARLNLSRESGR